MRVIRATLMGVAVLATSACVFYPTGSGHHYDEVHHYHDDEAYYAPAPAQPDRNVAALEDDEKPAKDRCQDPGAEIDPWEDTPCEKAQARLIFEEDFEGGLGQWKTCAPWAKGFTWKVAGQGHRNRAAVLNDEDDRVPGGARLGSTWLMTKKAIDLRTAKRPKLRLHLKGGDGASAVQFRLVWSIAGGAYAEERPIGEPIASQRTWTMTEVDLSALKRTQGHLMVVAKVEDPDDDFAGPMIDTLAIYDETN